MTNQAPDPDVEASVEVFPTVALLRWEVLAHVQAFREEVPEERRRFRIESPLAKEVQTSRGTFYLVRRDRHLFGVSGPVELTGRVNVLLCYEEDGQRQSAYLQYGAAELTRIRELTDIDNIVALLYPLPEEELPDIDAYLAASVPTTLWDKEEELRAANPNLPLDRKDLGPDGPSLPREGFATRRGFGRW